MYKVTIQEAAVKLSDWKVVAAGTWTRGSVRSSTTKLSRPKCSTSCSMLPLRQRTVQAGTKYNVAICSTRWYSEDYRGSQPRIRKTPERVASLPRGLIGAPGNERLWRQVLGACPSKTLSS